MNLLRGTTLCEGKKNTQRQKDRENVEFLQFLSLRRVQVQKTVEIKGNEALKWPAAYTYPLVAEVFESSRLFFLPQFPILQNPYIFNTAIFGASGEHSQLLSILKHQRRKRSNTWKGRLILLPGFHISLLVTIEIWEKKYGAIQGKTLLNIS